MKRKITVKRVKKPKSVGFTDFGRAAFFCRHKINCEKKISPTRIVKNSFQTDYGEVEVNYPNLYPVSQMSIDDLDDPFTGSKRYSV